MRPTARRRLDTFWLALGAATVGLAALVGALAGDTERVTAYWIQAHVADGPTTVTEVIDYDFGPSGRHGILRSIPGLDPSNGSPTVASTTAPASMEIEQRGGATTLRIGDPDKTVNNRHRYVLRYELDTIRTGDEVAWDTVGTDWTVGRHNIEVHLTADRELRNPRCHKGAVGERGGCVAIPQGPGHLVVEVGKLNAGEGVRLDATLGEPVTVVLPTAPVGDADDPGSGWKAPALIAVGAALVGSAAVSFAARRLGREEVWAGGPAEAAFGPGRGEALPIRIVDHSELEEMATTEFASPRDLTAPVGGVIHAERVTTDHRVAWLLERAIADEVELDDTDEQPVLRRGTRQASIENEVILSAMFGGRAEVELGKYDKDFAQGWDAVGSALGARRDDATLWSPAGDRRRDRFRVLGFLGVLAGLVGVLAVAVFANRWGRTWLSLLVPAGVVAGAGWAALIRSWELHVRSPLGSALWLQVESFRRFLAASEGTHAQRAAEMGLLRQYTAWAAALGELDHWNSAVESASLESEHSHLSGTDLAFASMAPAFASATRSASTAPSSGGGGGGGVGGGGGGGGGGSW